MPQRLTAPGLNRRRANATDLLARAEANGYKRGAHTERDQVKDDKKHNVKTQKNHRGTLRRYVLWQLGEITRDHTLRGLPVPSEEEVHTQCLRPGVEAPSLATIKDFFRFYIATSCPQLTGQPTTDSMGTIAEWFFAGFASATGTVIPEDERSGVYGWFRKSLTAEGLLVNKRKPKHNFTLPDLTRTLLTLWTRDDLIFIPERYRVQFTFIIRVFCWTGARIGAFFSHGLRYRDIELVLQRTPNAPWKLIYKIVFGTALQEQDQFIYDDTAFLLSMAMADQALYGFDTLADLQAQQIPTGDDQIVLRWRESALDKPILRKYTKAGGLSAEPMPVKAFREIFQSTLRNAGYHCSASVHSIRRQLGKKVDELYTEVQRSQQLTQADPRIFGQSYVANTSSVDGQGAFLGQPVDHSHVDYFQSLERFREPGLPCELPAHVEERLKQDPKIQQLEANVRRCSYKDPSLLKESKQRLAGQTRALRRSTLHEYQQEWMQERRDWKVMTRGNEQSNDLCRTDLVHSLSLLFPERRRLAQRLTADEALTPETRWLAMEDLYLLCTRDFSVLYLPGLQPIEGCCPVKCCQLDLKQLQNTKRNQHILSCVRREIASKREYLQSEVHYCYQCFSWVVGPEEWDDHCQTHVKTLSSKRCGTMTYCHTLVRPAYCPFCLGQSTEPAGRRFESWCRDHALWQHIDRHLRGCQWMLACPHPLCDVPFSKEQDLLYHFVDEHRLSCTHPKDTKNLRTVPSDTEGQPGQKRGFTEEKSELSWVPPERFSSYRSRKKTRRGSFTIAPSLLSNADTAVQCPSPIDLVSSNCSFDMVETTSLSDNQEDHPLESCLNSNPQSLVHFGSCDSTVIDSLGDDLFSRFIRSPSPECVSADLTGESTADVVVDIDDLVSPSPSGPGRSNSPHHSLGLEAHPPLLIDTGHKPRIRLLVKPPQTKIVLRIPTAQRTDAIKKRPGPKKSKGNRREQQKTRRRR